MVTCEVFLLLHRLIRLFLLFRIDETDFKNRDELKNKYRQLKKIYFAYTIFCTSNRRQIKYERKSFVFLNYLEHTPTVQLDPPLCLIWFF